MDWTQVVTKGIKIVRNARMAGAVLSRVGDEVQRIAAAIDPTTPTREPPLRGRSRASGGASPSTPGPSRRADDDTAYVPETPNPEADAVVDADGNEIKVMVRKVRR